VCVCVFVGVYDMQVNGRDHGASQFEFSLAWLQQTTCAQHLSAALPDLLAAIHHYTSHAATLKQLEDAMWTTTASVLKTDPDVVSAYAWFTQHKTEGVDVQLPSSRVDGENMWISWAHKAVSRRKAEHQALGDAHALRQVVMGTFICKVEVFFFFFLQQHDRFFFILLLFMCVSVFLLICNQMRWIILRQANPCRCRYSLLLSLFI
jgi:hypothetical protein